MKKIFVSKKTQDASPLHPEKLKGHNGLFGFSFWLAGAIVLFAGLLLYLAFAQSTRAACLPGGTDLGSCSRGTVSTITGCTIDCSTLTSQAVAQCCSANYFDPITVFQGCGPSQDQAEVFCDMSLTVTIAGTGTGSVTDGASFTCSSATCSKAYIPNTSVGLTATPSGGSTFAGWSGGGCSGTGTCNVNMTSDQSVTATFNVVPPPTVSITCNGGANGAPCTIPYNTAATIAWSSTGATGCTVSPPGWTGVSGSQSTGPLTASKTYYTASCTGPGGTISAGVTVNVTAPTCLLPAFGCVCVNDRAVTRSDFCESGLSLSGCSVISPANGTCPTKVCSGSSGNYLSWGGTPLGDQPGDTYTPQCEAPNSPIAATCSASASSVNSNNPVTFAVAPSGGNGSFLYLWQYPLNDAACANLKSTTNSPDPAYQLCTTTPLNTTLAPNDFTVTVSDTAGDTPALVSCPGVGVTQIGSVQVSSQNASTSAPVASSWGFFTSGSGGTTPASSTISCLNTKTCTGTGATYNSQPVGDYTLAAAAGSAGTLYTLKDVTLPQAFAEKKSNPFVAFVKNIFAGLAHAWSINACLPGQLCSATLAVNGSAIFVINWNPEAQMNISPTSLSLTDTSPNGSVSIDDNSGAPGSQLDWSIVGIAYSAGASGWLTSPVNGAAGSVLQTGPAQTIPVNANVGAIPLGSCLGGSPCTATVTFSGRSDASGLATQPQFRSLTVTLTMGNPVFCSPASQSINTSANGGSASLTALGGSGSYTWSAPGGIPSSGSLTNFTVGYAASGTYIVTASSPGTSAPAACTVNVINVSCAFSANPTQIVVPSTSQLQWTCVNATSCGIAGSNGSSYQGLSPGTGTPGTQLVAPTSTTTYSLTCVGAGSVTYQATVGVTVLKPYIKEF